MGQCLSSPAHDTPERFKGRWQQGGLADGLCAFGATDKYGALGEPAKPTYTTADVGLGPKTREDNFGFMHDKAPTPLQLERIDEDAMLQGDSDSSPMKQQLQPEGPPPLEGGGRPSAQRKPINWTRGELVGQGAFGSVFVAMDNDTGELIAVKQVHIPRGGGTHAKKVEDNIRSVEEEVQLLQQFDHPNIVRYLGTEKSDDSLNIFLEYVPGGSIASLLAKFGSFKESVVRVYTKQILLGLEYLHSKGVMHRDIKGANILVDNTGLVKLADFGASKKLEDLVTVADGNKSVKGTPYWMAPEVITQTGHGRQADLWSVACTVLEMATGRPPWSVQYPSQVAAMFHIASSKSPPEIPQHLSPECKDFLYLCFNRDWKARPLAATLLRHPFLADVPLRSHSGGPLPNAAALAQAWRVPRSSSGTSMGAPEPCDSQFGTPSPLNPKLAAAAAVGIAHGTARISLQSGDSGPGESSAALSPLGHHAASRQQQWDTAAAPTPQQQQQAVPTYSGRMTGSPGKRPAMSLRASAPAVSGYASVALSQLAPLEPLPARPTALPPPAQQPSNPRGSNEGCSMLTSSSGKAEPVKSSGSSPRLEHDTSPAATAAAEQSPEAGVALQAQQEQAVMAGTEGGGSAGGPAGQTPSAAQRQRAPTATPNSTGTSSGTSKSDYNPMEEPSWMHPPESPLAGNATPTSALSGGDSVSGATPSPGLAAALVGGQEASSYAEAVLPGSKPAVAKPPTPVATVADSEDLQLVVAIPTAIASAVVIAPPFKEHPLVDHMVWTNEDGDIDALPWDMGGWSTGSSGQREGRQEEAAARRSGGGAPQQQQQQQQQQQWTKQQSDPVDEDALIGALSHKAQHDVRASMALFEKSLNIPAVHAPPSPKAAAAGSPPTVASVRAPLAEQAAPTAESIESRGDRGAADGRHDQHQLQPAAASATIIADDSRRRLAAAQHRLPAGQKPASVGTLPHVTPLAAAMGSLSGLGYGRGGGSGSDRESIWQQELSHELFRVKTGTGAAAGGGGLPNRRVSLHGSPLKRPGGMYHP